MKFHFLGFNSISDLLLSTTGIYYAKFHMVIVTFFVAVTGFIGTWIWEDPNAVWTLWVLMLIDYITGILKAIYNKRFSSFKLWRMPIYFIVTTMLLSLAFWMAKGTITFALMPTIVISGFYSVYFISIIENFGQLGWLPKPIIELLRNKFGIKRLIEKYNEESKKDEEHETR